MSDGSAVTAGPAQATGFGAAMKTGFNPDNGRAVIGSDGAVNGHSKFEIDPDQLPQVRAGLDEVREKYLHAQEAAVQLSQVTPPFADNVTINVVRQISERAEGGDGNLYDTAEAMVQWVDEFQAAVDQAIADHRRIDDENRMA